MLKSLINAFGLYRDLLIVYGAGALLAGLMFAFAVLVIYSPYVALGAIVGVIVGRISRHMDAIKSIVRRLAAALSPSANHHAA